MDSELQRIVAVLERTGAFALAEQANVAREPSVPKSVEHKDRELAEEKAAFSRIDTHVQDMVLRELHSLYPHAGVCAEEAGDLRVFAHVNEFRDGKETIILDPIDGSRNYLDGKPLWGISFALARGTTLELGAIHYPALTITLTTAKGKGTYLNGKKVTLASDGYQKSDPVRIGGTVNGADALRARFAQSWNARLYVGTFLGMLRSNSDALQDVELPAWKAYVGEDTVLYDLGCGPLAWEEAGGVVLGIDAEPINPIASWKRTPQGIVLARKFVMASDLEYGKAILDVLNTK